MTGSAKDSHRDCSTRLANPFAPATLQACFKVVGRHLFPVARGGRGVNHHESKTMVHVIAFYLKQVEQL